MDRGQDDVMVKVVQIGYKLDETSRSLPVVRMIFGYGLVVVFMGFAITSRGPHVQCLFVVASMVTLFVLEPIPYQSSCMLPLFLFPVARLLVAHKLFGVYMNDEILRSISSSLVGLIALKSPLSRRLSLYLLCVTGVQVGRVLVSVMLLVFLVSMVVDATMTTGILAGFVDPLIFEIYANNLRIRYAAHLRSGLKAPDASMTEVDFVFKDTAKKRPTLSGEARMNDTIIVTQDNGEEPSLALQELVTYIDRKEIYDGAASPLPQDLSQDPDTRREQVSEALRTVGIDLQKLGLKLEHEEAEEKSEASTSAPDSGALIPPPFGSKGKSAQENKANKREKGKEAAKGEKNSGPTADLKGEKNVQESSISKGKKDSVSDEASQPSSIPEKDHADMLDGKTSSGRQAQKSRGAKALVSSKGKSSKAQEETAADEGNESGEAVDASSAPEAIASKVSKRKVDKKEGASRKPPQHVHFSHVRFWDRTPSVASASRGDADTVSTSGTFVSKEPTQCFYITEHRQQVYKKGHLSLNSSPRARPDSCVTRGNKNPVIGTSSCVSDKFEDELGSSVSRRKSPEQSRFGSMSLFGVSESSHHFVLDFSGRDPGSRREMSRRHKDVIKTKRKLLRRKRKSTDLTAERIGSKDDSRAVVPDHRGDVGGDSSRTTKQQPHEKPWVEKVDESSMYNPFLATDVSFRLRRSLSKPGLLWKLGRLYAERGDSLRNLLLGRHHQVFATTEADQEPEPETPLSQLEKKERESLPTNVDWQPEEDDEKEHSRQKPSRQADKDRAEAYHEGGHGGVAPHAEAGHAKGPPFTEGDAKFRESGGLEAIILEEKEKAKVLRTAVLLALTYGASFGTTAAYGASNANDFLKKYMIKNIDLPDISLNYATWLLVHIPFCLVLMIIAAGIINFVHTRNYDIPDTSDAPPSGVVIRDRLHIMGRMSYGEYIAAFLVGAALILLALRKPTFMEDGWGHILGIESEVTDASVGIVIGMLAFLFPADILPETHQTQIIEWADLFKRLPWGVIFILGSASTITTAMEHNDVFTMLEERLLRLSVPPFYQQYLSMLVMGCVGELTTFKSRLVNFSRIGYKLSRRLRRAPHFFLLPVNVICQLSLILPSASPNNAMAFEMGSMTSLQMIVPGFITKALTIMLYMVLINYTVIPVPKSEPQLTTETPTTNLTTLMEDGLGAADFGIDVAQVAFD